MKGRLGLALAAMTMALSSGCVVASPDDDTYRDTAAAALSAAASEVGTIHEMVDLLDRGRITRRVVVTQLRYSEAALGTTAAGFESLNPPVGQDDLAASARELFNEASGDLHAARVAVHRRNVAAYAGIVDDLQAVAEGLQALEKSVS